jgi:hypothetical protein
VQSTVGPSHRPPSPTTRACDASPAAGRGVGKPQPPPTPSSRDCAYAPCVAAPTGPSDVFTHRKGEGRRDDKDIKRTRQECSTTSHARGARPCARGRRAEALVPPPAHSSRGDALPYGWSIVGTWPPRARVRGCLRTQGARRQGVITLVLVRCKACAWAVRASGPHSLGGRRCV